MLHRLLVECHRVLEDPAAAPAIKSIAGSAMLSALDENLFVPSEFMRATWRWLRSAPETYWSVEGFGSVNDPAIRSDSLSLLMNPASGAKEWRLGVHLLSGSGHAQYVTDPDLMALVEAATTGGRALDLAGLVVAVHKARGVADAMIAAIRDKWTQGTTGMREAAVMIAGALPEPDMAWMNRVLTDPEPDVRACIASHLEREGRWHDGVSELLVERLRLEGSPDVRAAFHRALAALEQVENDRDRRRRRREQRLLDQG